ncbi:MULTISPECIES: hypothetical protein [Paraburkholderia]|uniref:hypothetical protein n=1 Tax=Paraburkholderia TaxID=1822464 RepID=UPI000368F403|nr:MULTISPECIES: hypothetical protein [Paraburkholderia]MDH6148669.1 hypothetical protein [Paraburkholderia sp. WSM4179]
MRVLQSLPQPGKRRRTARIAMDRVALDGEPGAGDVVVRRIRQRIGELSAPFGAREIA